MWNTSCTNKICFTKEKTYEQDLHLKRLYSIRPRITITEPYIPYFLHSGGWQREKKRQEETKVEKLNTIFYSKVFEARFKPGKYNKYKIEPKLYPAFQRFNRYKLSDIINMIRIRNDNIKMENKISEIKSTYERGEMRKEAFLQKKYLYNLLNRPKSIPYAPQLNFLSIDQYNNRHRSQIIKGERHFKTQINIGDGRRRNSMIQLRKNKNNTIDKFYKNKSLNGSDASNKNQNLKRKKSLNIDSDINNVINKKEDNINSTAKKNNKKETTTKSNTGMKK
jgi:hypothetical protein